MIEINNEVKNALIKIEFIEKYKSLSNRFTGDRIPDKERLIYVEIDEVISMIEDCGYKASYDKKE